MRRIAAIALLVSAAGLLVALPASGDDGGDYKVRAIFDNGSFLVTGEEVRVAGARVGTIDAVDVSKPGEIVSREDGGRAIPGKAVIVLSIEDDGFKDFRQDASCIIRPQSLIGERFVDCSPTEPRAAGEPPPPALEQIPAGQPGEGQRLLPLENNGKLIDLDLVQNIQRRPYRERFRLILNELGAGLAARGKDLAQIVERGNPALKQTDRVLKILARQNRQLASLAANGDRALEPLAREREHVTGFIANAGAAAQAAAERKPEIEAGLQRLPGALREVRLTMRDLNRFAVAGAPVFEDLNAVAPDLSRATQALGPFSTAATGALVSLGDVAGESADNLIEADDLLVDLRNLGNRATPVSRQLKKVLDTFTRTNGIRYLMDLIYNGVGTVNGYDSYGHYMRQNVQLTACLNYQVTPLSGCVANFGEEEAAASSSNRAFYRALAKARRSQGRARPATRAGSLSAGIRQALEPFEIPELEPLPPGAEQPIEPAEPLPSAPARSEPARSAPAPEMLLDFLLGGGA